MLVATVFMALQDNDFLPGVCYVPAYMQMSNNKTRKFRTNFSKGYRGGDHNDGTQQDQEDPSGYKPSISNVHLDLSDHGYCESARLSCHCNLVECSC